MTYIDLKDAYLSVHVHKSSQTYLCFQWRNRCHAFLGLPFGLNTAPRVFTKLLKPIAAYLRKRGIRINVYLHDFLILGSSIEESKANTRPSPVARFHHKLGEVPPSPHSVFDISGPLHRFTDNVTQSPREKDSAHTEQMSKSHSQSHYISSCSGKPHRDIGGSPPCHLAGTPSLQTLTNTAHKIPTGFSRQYETLMSLNSNAHAELPWWLHNITTNLVPRSHSVTGNVRSGKVRQYAIFHWPLKKGCGNTIYASIGLFRGARDEGLVFASSCAVLNKYQLCGGKFFFFFPTPEKLYSKGKSF